MNKKNKETLIEKSDDLSSDALAKDEDPSALCIDGIMLYSYILQKNRILLHSYRTTMSRGQ